MVDTSWPYLAQVPKLPSTDRSLQVLKDGRDLGLHAWFPVSRGDDLCINNGACSSPRLRMFKRQHIYCLLRSTATKPKQLVQCTKQATAYQRQQIPPKHEWQTGTCEPSVGGCWICCRGTSNLSSAWADAAGRGRGWSSHACVDPVPSSAGLDTPTPVKSTPIPHTLVLAPLSSQRAAWCSESRPKSLRSASGAVG